MVGASRPRTQYFDLVRMFGKHINISKAHQDLSFVVREGINISFMWHDIAKDFTNGGSFGHLPRTAIKLRYCQTVFETEGPRNVI